MADIVIAYCLRMISAQTLRVCRRENRFTVFRIMRYGAGIDSRLEMLLPRMS
jgi:hypothetical protein